MSYLVMLEKFAWEVLVNLHQAPFRQGEYVGRVLSFC